jgi:hypothetical protein
MTRHLDTLFLAALLLALAGAVLAALTDLPPCGTDTECGCAIDCTETTP